MESGKIMGLIAAAALAACAVPSGKSADSDQAIVSSAVESNVAGQSPAEIDARRSEAPAAHASIKELPSDACTREGYWSFFEAFTQSPEIRQAFTDNSAKDAINPFRISLVDHQWVYVGTDQGLAPETLSLKETLGGDSFKVEYVRAEFNEDDDVVNTHGAPGTYEFQLKDGCWRLTNAM